MTSCAESREAIENLTGWPSVDVPRPFPMTEEVCGPHAESDVDELVTDHLYGLFSSGVVIGEIRAEYDVWTRTGTS